MGSRVRVPSRPQESLFKEGFLFDSMIYFVELGYLGLFIASFLTATLVPLSPEVVLGILIAKGFNLQFCIVIACMGNWLGGVTTYYIGRIGDWKKIENSLD